MSSALILGLVWFGAVALLLARMLRQFRAHRALVLPAPPPDADLPRVAVIVPARNEAANMAPCLEGLLRQKGADARMRILVVDDGSRDQTGDIVYAHMAEDAPLCLLPAGLLPPGWMGKPHACWRGALASEEEWLCFIDADVRASPDLIAASLWTAEAEAIDMLSLHAFQELGSFFERLIVPAGILMIACAKDLQAVDDAESPEVTANGQFILVRREAYFRVGGHAAVCDQVCEDKALARRIKQAGLRLRVLAGEHLMRTRMYRGLRSLWEGFAKNAVEIVGHAQGTLAAAAGGLLAALAIPLVPAAAILAAIADPSASNLLGLGLAVIASLTVIALHAGTLRRFEAPLWYILLLPVGLMLASAIAVHSVILRSLGRVTWKGRQYELEQNNR